MTRTKPAIFRVKDASGRYWTVRVGMLGIEALLYGPGYWPEGQERHSATWAEVLPKRKPKTLDPIPGFMDGDE